jgi:hypothetical protein
MYEDPQRNADLGRIRRVSCRQLLLLLRQSWREVLHGMSARVRRAPGPFHVSFKIVLHYLPPLEPPKSKGNARSAGTVQDLEAIGAQAC